MTTTMHEKFDVLLATEGDHECEGLGKDNVCVRVVAMAELPTRFGDFHIVAFENNKDGKEHVAITRGDVIGASDVPVRLHSECKRTGTSEAPITSPLVMATCSLPSRLFSNATMWKSPKRVGSSAIATTRTHTLSFPSPSHS